MKPACVKACPTGALAYGPREVLLDEAKARAAEKKLTLYGEKELGGLGWLYLLDVEPAAVGLPVDPRLPTRGIFGKWFAGVLPGLAILGGLGWLFGRREAVAAAKAKKKKA
jgi:formate dehydrogenase iron-sulfur subunit